MEAVKLSPDLGERAVERFDKLKACGKLFYEPSEPEYIADNGFLFEFRISPINSAKPILAVDDPGRRTASGPFSEPETDFVIASVGPSHLLQLGKFCMFRPSFILHPKQFAEQTTDLDDADFEAVWAVMDSLEVPQMVLYNCGVDAGSSQGHKHLQILPRPGPEFEMFPDKACLSPDEVITLPHVPFMHWVVGIPKGTTSKFVANQYHRVLAQSRKSFLATKKSTAYNFILVREWLIIIPRASKGRNGIGANGAGMMGLVWIRDETERQGWTQFGLSKYLGDLGIPNLPEH